MAAIVTGGPDRDYYLNVQQAPASQTKPAVTRNNVPVTTAGVGRPAGDAPQPLRARSGPFGINAAGATIRGDMHSPDDRAPPLLAVARIVCVLGMSLGVSLGIFLALGGWFYA